MLRHPHFASFIAAAKREYSALDARNTWEHVPIESIIKLLILLLMWVFTYKFDEASYLIKYKARIVMRGDLYQNQQAETYAATLATKVF